MKKLIIDFDSTLVKIETLDELARRALEGRLDKEEVLDKIKKTTELGMNGEISFPESLERRIALIETTKESVLELGELIKKEISDSVLKNIIFFKDNARDIIVISGGFRDLIFPTTDFLGIARENVWANDFIFKDRILVGINKDNLMSKDRGKVNQIKDLKLEGELIMVGDGWTDYQARESGAVDKFIAYSENVSREKVLAVADIIADDFGKIAEMW